MLPRHDQTGTAAPATAVQQMINDYWLFLWMTKESAGISERPGAYHKLVSSRIESCDELNFLLLGYQAFGLLPVD